MRNRRSNPTTRKARQTLTSPPSSALRGANAPADPPPREIKQTFAGLTCTRCGKLFEDELESDDHLNGPACSKPE